jgi:hypothetical protein
MRRNEVKKLVLALLMAATLAGGVFAVDFSMSAGLGGTFAAGFQNYAWTDDGKKVVDSGVFGSKDTNVNDQNQIGGGFFAYFDATYAMLSLGMDFYDLSPANKDAKKALDKAKTTYTLSTFDISLLGKYPIALGAASLFPMLGVDFKIAVSHDMTVNGKKYTFGKDYNKNDNIGDYFTSVWLKFGAGADIPLGQKLYLRPMFLYGFGSLPKETKDSMDAMNKGKKMADIVLHGLEVKVAVGYKF